MSFHNTTQESPDRLKQLMSMAISQEEKIKTLFRLEKRPLAWFEVKALLPQMNDCSIKRALSNLTNPSKYPIPFLMKTDSKADHYGVTCRRYEIVKY